MLIIPWFEIVNDLLYIFNIALQNIPQFLRLVNEDIIYNFQPGTGFLHGFYLMPDVGAMQGTLHTYTPNTRETIVVLGFVFVCGAHIPEIGLRYWILYELLGTFSILNTRSNLISVLWLPYIIAALHLMMPYHLHQIIQLFRSLFVLFIFVALLLWDWARQYMIWVMRLALIFTELSSA